MIIQPARNLSGTVALPGDKSIAHRYAILGAMAHGVTKIHGFPESADCQSTLSCLSQLGVQVRRDSSVVTLESPGWQGFKKPGRPLDAGNSGTTMRLLAGVLAALPFESSIQGDKSLGQRPMQRIITPLEKMGARIQAREGTFPPLQIDGHNLTAIHYETPVASAQVKSCILLAGLAAVGKTKVVEKSQSRDHTERALPVFGVPISCDNLTSSVAGPLRLTPAEVRVPGDFSAASFFVLATLTLPDSKLTFRDLGVNPTRTGVLDLLETCDVSLERSNTRLIQGEPICDLTVRYSPTVAGDFPSEIGGSLIPNVIDEIPVLAVLGTRLKNGFRVSGASELRKKESDRIASVVHNLRALGITVEEYPDGFFIAPGQQFHPGQIKTFGDHRIAMAFSIAGLLASGPVELDNPSCVSVSFPGFFEQLKSTSASSSRT